MTDPHEPFRFRPRPLPEAYLREAANNQLWLSVLRAALRRGLSDREACQEANDAVTEALEPSQFPDGKPFPEERREPDPPAELFALRREPHAISCQDGVLPARRPTIARRLARLLRAAAT